MVKGFCAQDRVFHREYLYGWDIRSSYSHIIFRCCTEYRYIVSILQQRKCIYCFRLSSPVLVNSMQKAISSTESHGKDREKKKKKKKTPRHKIPITNHNQKAILLNISRPYWRTIYEPSANQMVPEATNLSETRTDGKISFSFSFPSKRYHNVDTDPKNKEINSLQTNNNQGLFSMSHILQVCII
jgi:hypothetical protein